MSIEKIAQACHEVNRVFCFQNNDFSQPSWEDAPQWQKDSAIKGVEFVRDNPDAPPSSNHECWLAVKEAEGWVYGPVKDADKKEHPCMVPYDELPPVQRAKDTLFRTVALAMLAE